ncbi:hypothetical protein E2C01_058252 [Portunus trituberculatus]|uniref:Uncharacterized protein n=1 Tax=Portunus trituberculatus TaxID=210409 RepID=A0A5B7GVX6_PORTR|nr:hypothetical protein [Portunus trituberculatus]
MSQFASFLELSGTAQPECLKDVVKEVVEETVVRELPNFVLVSAPPPLSTAVTSGAPPSPDVPPLIYMSQVGVAGEGRLAAGVTLHSSPSLVNLDRLAGSMPQVNSGSGHKQQGKEPKDLKGRNKHSRLQDPAHSEHVAQHGSVTSYDEPRPLDSHDSWLGDEVSSPQSLRNSWQGSDGRSQDSSAGEDEQQPERDSSDFLTLANFVYDQFPESKGVREDFCERSPGPGQEDFLQQKGRDSFTPFRWSRPLLNLAQFVDRCVSDRLHAGSSATLPHTRRGKRKAYVVSDDDQKRKGSVVNPSLAPFLPQNFSDIRPPCSGSDLLHLEEAVRGIREIQNFQFWVFGAFSRLAVSSMQQAMQSASRETTMVLSNILTFRRQAVLKTLPSSFSVSNKRSLLQSSSLRKRR